MTSCTGSVRAGFWEIWEKVSWAESCLGRKRLTFARSPRPCSRCHTWFGTDGKVSIERWYLSPYVEKPFNSKVIKKLRTRTKKSEVFFVFRDSYVLCYIWTFYEHYMYVSRIHVWLCYTPTHVINLKLRLLIC